MGRPPGTTVFVGNISYDTTEDQLKDVFSQVGNVLSFRLMYDHDTGRAKGFGFCEYEDKDTAMSARRNLNGTQLNGRPLRVDLTDSDKQNASLNGLALATPNQPNPPHAQTKKNLGQGPNHLPPPADKAHSALPPALASSNPSMATMSLADIHQTMLHLKKAVVHNPNEMRDLLLTNPRLAHAILQGQIMLGMVPPPILPPPSQQQPPLPSQQQQQQSLQQQQPLLPQQQRPLNQQMPPPSMPPPPVPPPQRATLPRAPPPQTAPLPQVAPPPCGPSLPRGPLPLQHRGLQPTPQRMPPVPGQRAMHPPPLPQQPPPPMQMQMPAPPGQPPMQNGPPPGMMGGPPPPGMMGGPLPPPMMPQMQQQGMHMQGPPQHPQGQSMGDEQTMVLRKVMSMSQQEIEMLPEEHRAYVMQLREMVRANGMGPGVNPPMGPRMPPQGPQPPPPGAPPQYR